jgi:GT2 family glycosyltransferase
VIAYTDDDVVVDPGWVSALAQVFGENPEVMAVTGLVVPYELETEPQVLFEQYGGFGRGFEQKWYRLDHEKTRRETFHIHASKFGTGANMAYRRSLLEKLGGFDPALDVGTVTNGAGDLDIFFRVLQEGYVLVYEPSAIVRHRHRRDYSGLRTQVSNNGISFYAYLVRNALAYPTERWAICRFGLGHFWRRHLRRLLLNFLRPTVFPRELIVVELKSIFRGLCCYPKARRRAAQIARTFGPVT